MAILALLRASPPLSLSLSLCVYRLSSSLGVLVRKEEELREIPSAGQPSRPSQAVQHLPQQKRVSPSLPFSSPLFTKTTRLFFPVLHFATCLGRLSLSLFGLVRFLSLCLSSNCVFLLPRQTNKQKKKKTTKFFFSSSDPTFSWWLDLSGVVIFQWCFVHTRAGVVGRAFSRWLLALGEILFSSF